MKPIHQRRIIKAKTGLLVIDLQERLWPAIFDKERVLQNCVRLIKGAGILGVPVFATEQYRKGLGCTLPQVVAALGDTKPIEKVAFSACGAEGLVPAMEAQKISDVLLCGLEAHVCVCQSCLDLLQADSRIFVVADAISSRTRENHQLGLERMRDAGAIIVSTEMVLFELLEKAGSEEFKQILQLVR